MTVTDTAVYITEATKRSPFINFDKSSGEMRIEGKSLPEYAYAYYGKLMDEVDDYMINAQEQTVIKLKFEYFNTISSKLILQILLKFESLLTTGKKVEVKWYYNEDDDMMIEMGKIYQSSTKIPVSLIKVQD